MNTIELAAAKLEARPSQEGIPYERYTEELWHFIDMRLAGYGPSWFRRLTISYRLGGAGFRYPLDDRDYIGICVIPRPSIALWHAYQPGFIDKLYKHGFTCFADGKDENVWLFKNTGGENPEVFFLENTAWNGSEPTIDNGLIKSGLSLGALLSYGADWREEN